jgi:hypothetical protein
VLPEIKMAAPALCFLKMENVSEHQEGRFCSFSMENESKTICRGSGCKNTGETMMMPRMMTHDVAITPAVLMFITYTYLV